MFCTAARLAFEALFPQICLVCGRPATAAPVCFRCRPTTVDVATRCLRCFEWLPLVEMDICEYCSNTNCSDPLETQRFLWTYDARAAELFWNMKTGPSTALARWAGELMADALKSRFVDLEWDQIVPVPPSAQGLRKRGFNQSLIFADAIGAKLDRSIRGRRPAVVDLLVQQRAAEPQKLLPPELRRDRATRFGLQRDKVVLQRILLVDDVATSGSTSYAAADELRRAGATCVDFFSLARAPRWYLFRPKAAHDTV